MKYTSLSLLHLYAIVNFVSADINFTTKLWFIKQHKSIIYENLGKLSGSDPNGHDYMMSAQKNKADLKLNGGKEFETQVAEGMVNAKDIYTGQQASANKIGTGGMAQAGSHRGNMRTNKDNDGNMAYLDGDSAKLTAKQIGSKSFIAQSANNNWEINPASQSLTDGKGTIIKDGKLFNYQINNMVNGEASAVLRDNTSSVFSKSTQFTCKMQSVGLSTCFDEWGKKVGEVRANSNGEVTITDHLGVPVVTAKASKDKDGKPMVVVNNGLFTAQSDNQQDFNCPGVPTDSITINKPLLFKYFNQRTTGGGVEYDWPACIEIEADIVLKPGISAKNLAFKWTVMILPIGRLNCNNPTGNICSKGGDCLFCNLCDPQGSSKANFLDNVMTNICEAKGDNAFTVKATVCPPPEANNLYYCNEFTKSLGDVYWMKKGDLDVVFEVYNRKTDTEFRAEWQDLKRRASLIASYKADPNVYEQLQSILTIPSKEEVKNWYMMVKAEKIACHESIVSYTLSGSKINTDFLLEAATIGGIFKKNQCKSDQN